MAEKLRQREQSKDLAKRDGESDSENQEYKYQASDGQDHLTPKPPKYRLDIEVNTLPKNWWDQLPDFNPRIYDAIQIEQAAACVAYVFNGLPDIHELENLIESRKFRLTCPKLKVDVPRTAVMTPYEIKGETSIDSFINKEVTY